jgi:hypothetical protein
MSDEKDSDGHPRVILSHEDLLDDSRILRINATVIDDNYQGSASGTLVIAKALLNAVVDDKGRVQGAANPAFTITYTGFVNGETAAVPDTPPTASTMAIANSPAGTYPIALAGGTDPN